MALLGIFLKLGVDIVFLIGVFVLVSSPIFIYMSDLTVHLTSITYTFGIVSISGNSQEICDTISIEELCETFEAFIKSGYILLVFLVLSCISLVLSLSSLLTTSLNLKIKFLQLKVYHILYPILYNTGVLIYVLSSDLYSLPDYGLGDDYKMQGQLGLYFMYFLSFLSVFSLISYCTSKPFCICDQETPLLQ